MSTNNYAAAMGARWLDAREDRAWRGFHRLRAELLGHLSRQMANTCDLSVAEYEILVVVSEAPGRRIRARDLCRQLQWERSRLSHQISRMEARDLLARDRCATDARGFDVTLTDHGLATIEAAAPLHLEAVRHCFADLLTPEQLDALAEISAVICRHLVDEHGEQPDGACHGG